MYAYCLNNPANMIDSDGKFAITLTGIGLIAGGMAIIGSFYAGSRWYAKKPVNLPSHKKIKVNIDHILNNHTVNGQGGPQKDKFPFWMKAKLIESIVRNAYKNGDKVKSQGDNIFMRGPGFGDSIIEMWVNKITKTIETAWPKLPK